MNSSTKKFQTIQDYIYGLISIPKNHIKFIDSYYVQRLRNIRQIPTAQYLFPSVNHSCFEHSLGTYYLSNKFITNLKNRQNDLDINQTLINTISLCGLFNNIGTVPYLQSFQTFYKEKYKKEYDIKQKAYEIILKLIESKGIDPESISENDDENIDLDIIKNIFTKSNNNPKFYEKIVFNPQTGIDCESFDNLNRDAYKYGDKPSFDYNILMNSAHIINNDICYHINDSFSVYDYYYAKYTMTTKYYNHRVPTAIELMIADVYKLIDQVTPLNDIINNSNKYLYFFDSFIHNIKYNEKNDKIINKAKLILNNIDKRNLYTSIGDYYLSDNELVINQDQFENFNENTLVENINKSDGELKSTDIRIKKDIICLGSGNNDPFNNLLFYDNKFNTIKLKAEDVSKLVSNRYKHKIIRVFLTTKDKQKIKAAQNALINYKNKYKGNAYLHKSEQKIEKEEDNVKSFQLNEGIFKNNKKDNFNKDSRLGKKREIEKGYSMFHDQLFKKKK
jgi:HD superfamily phosphohydrolase